MNEEPTRQELPPEESSPSSGWLKIAAIVLLAVASFSFTYAWMEHRSAQDQAASHDALTASFTQTRNQVDILTAKLNALTAAQAVVPESTSDSALAPSTPKEDTHRSVSHATRAKRHSVHSAEDARWKKVQSELAEQQQQLAEHRQQIQATQESVQKTRSELEGNLNSTRDELNGSSAKNHDQLVALEKKGERNYYEFDLWKSKQYSHAGPVSISLRKANTKHDYCDLQMLVSDSQLSKKHVNLYEPVFFYPEGYAQPLELVINRIGKNFAHGYVSEPKYKPSELASNAAGGRASATANDTAQSPAVVGLQHRPGPQQ